MNIGLEERRAAVLSQGRPFFMTGPIPLTKIYPAHLQLCYRGVKYRPAALQLFVARGGWGAEYIPTTKPPVKAALKAVTDSDLDGGRPAGSDGLRPQRWSICLPKTYQI